MITTEALERAWAEERHYLRGVALRCSSGDVEDAQDLMQEAFLKAWRGRDTFHEGCTARWWLAQIVRNCGTDLFRKRRIRPGRARFVSMEQPFCYQGPHGDGDTVGFLDVEFVRSDPEDDPAHALIDREGVRVLLRQIDRLHPSYGGVLKGLARGLSYEEIALREGVCMGTVRSRINRARKLLRQEMKEMNEMKEAAP